MIIKIDRSVRFVRESTRWRSMGSEKLNFLGGLISIISITIIQMSFAKYLLQQSLAIIFYNSKQMKAKSPSWSILGKKEQVEIAFQQKPDPTSYNMSKCNLKKQPSWKMGKSVRNTFRVDKSPGPGQYQQKKAEKNTKFGTIGKENILNSTKINDNPGPNSYQPKMNNFTVTSYCFPKKSKQDNPAQKLPGPGEYEPKKLMKSSSNHSFGKQSRFQSSKEHLHAPGPGAYESNRAQSSKLSFSKQKRLKFSENTMPGPGSYQIAGLTDESVLTKKGYSISGKYRATNLDKTPGPESYSPKPCNKEKSPSFTMSKKYVNHATEELPSSNSYYPVDKSKQNSFYFSIGKAERQNAFSRTVSPGPAAYLNTNYNSKESKSPMYSLGMSRVQEKISENPGPGIYTPKVDYTKRRPQSANMCADKRKTHINTNPGPGTYESKINNKNEPKCVFTKKDRLTEKTENYPGPGEYEVPSLIGNVSMFH